MKQIDKIHDGLRELMHQCSVPEDSFDPFDKYKTDYQMLDQDEPHKEPGYVHEIHDQVDWNLKRAIFDEVLLTLTERERLVIECRFFKDMTFNQVGKIINVSRSRAQQIEAKALRKLRHPKRSEKLQKTYYPEQYERDKISRLAALAEQRELEKIRHDEWIKSRVNARIDRRREYEEMKRIQQQEKESEELCSYSFVDVFGMVKWVVR